MRPPVRTRAALRRARRRRASAFSLVGALLAIVVGLWAFQDAPLSYDESATLLGRDSAVYQETFLYPRLQAAWILTFGPNHRSARMLAGAFALTAAAASLMAARRAGGDPVAAALLLAGCPSLLIYGVLLRHYGLLLAAAAASVGAVLWVARRGPSSAAFVLAAGSGVLAFLVHPTAALSVIGPQLLALGFLAWRSRPAYRSRCVAGWLAVAAVELLAVAVQARRIAALRQEYTALPQYYPGPTLGALGEALGSLGFAPDAGPLGAAVGALAFGLMIAAGLRAVWRSRRARALAILLVAPAALVFVGSFYQPMLIGRVLLPVVPAGVAAAALASRGDRVRRGRALAAILAVVGVVDFSRGAWIAEDTPGALRALASVAEPGDGLVVHPPYVRASFDANLPLAGVRLPRLRPLPLDAPGPFAAAKVDYARLPRRLVALLEHDGDHSLYLEAELRLHFDVVRELGWFRGPYQVLLCEGPLPREVVLARIEAAEAPAALRAFRRGSTLLHAGDAAAALEAFLAAREALARGPVAVDNPLARRDDQVQAAWAVAWSAHRAGRGEVARAALRESEELGNRVAPELRARIMATTPSSPLDGR